MDSNLFWIAMVIIGFCFVITWVVFTHKQDELWETSVTQRELPGLKAELRTGLNNRLEREAEKLDALVDYLGLEEIEQKPQLRTIKYRRKKKKTG